MNSAEQFEAIVSDHYQPLFRFAMSLTRIESDARDLTQQTFYIWATKGHQLRDFSRVKTWLFTTLHRTFLETRRRASRFTHETLEEVSAQLPAPCPELSNYLDSAQVLPALAQVDRIYQGAVALFYLENCSYKDIAAILEVPVGTVKSRIARGIVQLRRILLSGGSTDSGSTETNPKEAEPAEYAESARNPHQLQQETSEQARNEWDLSSTFFWDRLTSAVPA
jgi:RNA polymerase sigma-70 factor (ECF subfamily)